MIDLRVAAERERRGESAPPAYGVADARQVVERAWAEYSGTVASRLAMGAGMTAELRAIEMRGLDPAGLASALGEAVFGRGPMGSLDGAAHDDPRLQAAQRWADSMRDVPSSGMVVPLGLPPDGQANECSIDHERLGAEMARRSRWWSRLAAAVRRAARA